MKTTPTAREIGALWFEKVWNQRDSALACELMSDAAVGYLEGGIEVTGPHEFLNFQSSFLAAVPDMKIEVVNSLADDDDVCVEWIAKGTHTGAGLGVPPSGQVVSFRGVTWFQVSDGKITSGRDFWNRDGLMKTMAAGSM
jgi:steroid delta-isomerase-like uncharacterized protein